MKLIARLVLGLILKVVVYELAVGTSIDYVEGLSRRGNDSTNANLINLLENVKKTKIHAIHTKEKSPSFKPSSDKKLSFVDDIVWHGDPVLKGIINLYNVYLGFNDGDYEGKTTPTILANFAKGLSGSGYANILTSYYDANGYMSNQYAFKGNVYLNSNRTSLTDKDVLDIFNQAYTKTGWQRDPNGIITLFFRGDIIFTDTYDGAQWLHVWCGYHDSFIYNSLVIPFAIIGDTNFVKDPNKAQGCRSQFSGGAVNLITEGASPICLSRNYCSFNSPNNNTGADSMVSTYAHEIVEAATDTLNGWYSRLTGYENADLCNYDFGYIFMSNDVHYNQNLSTGLFLIQTNWRLKNDALGYPVSKCANSSAYYSLIKPTSNPSFKSLSPTKSTSRPIRNPTNTPSSLRSRKPTRPLTKKPLSIRTKIPTRNPTTATKIKRVS